MGESPPPWGKTPHPLNPNRRQLPQWMDPKGDHGEMQFLQVKPVAPAKLPIYPFIIAKTVEQEAGIIHGGNPTDNGSTYLLKVRSPRQVEILLKVKQLIDSTPVTITYHPTLNTCKCVVTCKEVEGATNEQLASDLESQGVTSVYRFLRKENEKDIPTHTMVLTVRGTVVPRYIRFGFLQISTRPYYSRPMLCVQCGKFGHTQKNCKFDPICINCGDKEVHSNCKKEPHCVNCRNNHPTNSRTCSFFKEEQEIIKLKTDTGISHKEAVKELRSRLIRSSSIQQRLNPERNPTNQETEIIQLRKQVAILTAQLAMFTRRPQDNPTNDENESESDGSMTTSCSTASHQTTPKRIRNGSSEGMQTSSESSSGTTTQQKLNRTKKKRQRNPENQINTENQPTSSNPGKDNRQLSNHPSSSRR
ncbi:uncharacterized protein LOC129760386 [Uranotaenia lowii]|uniref:uncharacterized protein LOC129741045 n=1 Tax=Uranotaenia lowii TaxID=190385 RepID=UPI00247A0C33|nr:uncharacterized protein LOC129741045 [Uranotaenia lowii]XP_055614009.1 uncharacterized protein LOC129760386 [Uranotaenia lowii]